MIVVSHRGPASFLAGNGRFAAQPAPGGLSSTLRSLFVGTGSTWVAAAVSDDDRAAVRAGDAALEGLDLRLLDIDPAVHRLHYDLVSNATLWYLHHSLFDLPRRPRFDRRFDEAWEGYAAVNATFADAVLRDAADGDVVLVQDYQLTLVPGLLRRARPDLKIVHFTHSAFCGPNSIRVLPDHAATDMCASMATSPCGFHTDRWARAYLASAREVLGPEAPIANAFTAPLAADADVLHADAAQPEVADALVTLDDIVGDRLLVLRVDRLEPSKNIVRGFHAYALMLDEHPDLRERVVFVAYLNPSRESLADYLAYRSEVEQAASFVNERHGRPGWQPVILDMRDDFSRSLAAYQRYDALLVNPIRDGLNIVAKEGPILNRNDGVLCLSRDAGAFDELAPAALAVHPYDIAQTAAVLYRALTMSGHERRKLAEDAHAIASARRPKDWLDDLLAHADRN